MKRKLMTLGFITIMALACAGCGKKEAVTDEVAQVTEAATEEVTEETTKEATKETKKADKDSKKTKQDKENKTDKDNKTQKPDKDTGKQRTTEAASSRTGNSTASSSTGQSSASTPSTEQPSTRQPSTSAPSTEQPSTRQPSTQSCNHNWVEITQTVHHEAEMGERGVTPAIVYHWYCRICGCYYPDVNSDPCGGVNGSDADYVVQEAVWESYVVTPAYDETVGTGRYRCSRCGATK